MLSLTRKADYALVAMADLARKRPSTVSAGDMANRLGMPFPLLQGILTHLRHNGLVVSTRGVQGGYRLSKRPEEITLGELINAVEGNFRLTPCCHDDSIDPADACKLEQLCAIRGPVRKVHRILERCLNQVTVAQLAYDMVPVGLSLSSGTQRQTVSVDE